MEKEIDIGGYKVSSMVVMVGTGIIAMVIFYYFFTSSSSASTSSTSSAGTGAANALAAYTQYAGQMAQISAAQQASTQQYSLGMAQIQDQLAATQSTNNAANQQTAIMAGASMANGLTQLGGNNTNALLAAVSNTYAANYQAGTNIAQTALNAAGANELAGLITMNNMQNSSNTALSNIALAQNNTLSNLFTSIGGTVASVTQANAQWKAQSWQVCGHYAIAGGCAGTSNSGGNGAGS